MNEYTVICDDLEILDMFLEYMYSKKIIKKILKKNSKLEPFHVRIILKINKKDLCKIIKKKFYNRLILR